MFNTFGSISGSIAYRAARELHKLAVAMFLINLAATPLQAKDTFTIVMFGDSLTQGYGLSYDEGLVPQLQAWMVANGADVQLVNAGVSGDTTASGLARIDWTLDYSADAIVVELGGNDLLRGIFPDETRRNLAAILTIVAAKDLPVLLVGLPAPSNFGPEYKAEFDLIYPELAAEFGASLYPYYLEGLGAGQDIAALLPLMQADGIHPNAEGVAKIVAHIGPAILELANSVNP